MELPRFFSNETNDQSPPQQRSAPEDLSAEELSEISHMLDEQSGRRRRSSPTGVVRIMVDGIERGRLNPAERSSISFSVEENAEIVEVKTSDSSGELLLATHLLTSFGKDEHDATIVSSIRLEGGQELSLSITRRPIEATGDTDLLITFGYRETNAYRAARLWWQWLNLRFSSEDDPNSRSLWSGARIPILVGSVVVICLTVALLFLILRSPQTTGPAQTSVETAQRGQDTSGRELPTPADNRSNGSDKPIAKVTEPEPDRSPQQPRQSASDQPAPVNPAPSPDDVADDLTRSGGGVANLTLKEVKKVFIEVRGDSPSNGLRANIVDSLGSSGVIATTGADEADASLKIVILKISDHSKIEVTARLVNARGSVLWPKAGVRRYSGDTNKIVSEIVKDLLSEIRQARG